MTGDSDVGDGECGGGGSRAECAPLFPSRALLRRAERSAAGGDDHQVAARRACVLHGGAQRGHDGALLA